MKTAAEIIEFCQRNITERSESLMFDNSSNGRVIRLTAEVRAFESIIAYAYRDPIVRPGVVVVDLDLDPLETM